MRVEGQRYCCLSVRRLGTKAMGSSLRAWKKPLDGVIAVLWVLLSQFLMMGLEEAMHTSPFPFPASILAMMLVFTVLLVVGYAWDGLPEFYDTYLRGPVSELRLLILSTTQTLVTFSDLLTNPISAPPSPLPLPPSLSLTPPTGYSADMRRLIELLREGRLIK